MFNIFYSSEKHEYIKGVKSLEQLTHKSGREIVFLEVE